VRAKSNENQEQKGQVAIGRVLLALWLYMDNNKGRTPNQSRNYQLYRRH
jgi:hypothetical protein